MRVLSARRLLVAVTLATLGAAGCESTPPPPGAADMAVAPRDLAGGGDLAGRDQAGPIEFADFVLSLIQLQTSDNSLPATTEDKSFTDSMDPARFEVLFP